MAAAFNWAQRTGAPAGTNVELGSSGNVMNFQSADSSTPADYSTNVITASDSANGGNSYELWFRGHWTGAFSSISNLRFWRSAAFSNNTGVTIKYASTATYAQPTANDTNVSTGVTNTTTIPTSTPSANIGIANNLAGSLTVAGYSDYIVLQAHFATTATAGDSGLATFSLLYDET